MTGMAGLHCVKSSFRLRPGGGEETRRVGVAPSPCSRSRAPARTRVSGLMPGARACANSAWARRSSTRTRTRVMRLSLRFESISSMAPWRSRAWMSAALSASLRARSAASYRQVATSATTLVAAMRIAMTSLALGPGPARGPGARRSRGPWPQLPSATPVSDFRASGSCRARRRGRRPARLPLAAPASRRSRRGGPAPRRPVRPRRAPRSGRAVRAGHPPRRR